MGLFSWLTSDTKESIRNRYHKRKALPVYLITPENEKIYEPKYEGYGVFGGHDVFVLLARWNVPEVCTGDDVLDRAVHGFPTYTKPLVVKTSHGIIYERFSHERGLAGTDSTVCNQTVIPCEGKRQNFQLFFRYRHCLAFLPSPSTLL